MDTDTLSIASDSVSLNSNQSGDIMKPKRRSLVERELETNLTDKFTSPIGSSDENKNTSRYGRTRKINTHRDFIDYVKPQSVDVQPSNITSPASKILKSPVATTSFIKTETNSEVQLKTSNNKKTPIKPKIFVKKDLIVTKDGKPPQIMRNLFSPPNSRKRKSTRSLERSENPTINKEKLNETIEIKTEPQEKYSPNKMRANLSMVVKTLDFDTGMQQNRHSTGNKMFDIEAAADYQVGDLAWARFGTYPFWPCIVMREPSSGLFVKKKLFGRVARDVIHVVFFGDKGSRGWIVDNMLRPFNGRKEFEEAKQQFTPETKKRDPKLYAAFFVSEKKIGIWNTSIDEAESLMSIPKRLRIDALSELLLKTKKKKSSKVTRTDSDVSLSESLYTLFTENVVKSEFCNNKAVDVSDVVTACLDNMVAKTGITKIQKQSHMDRWLQKAKSKTPEKRPTRDRCRKKETKNNNENENPKLSNGLCNGVVNGYIYNDIQAGGDNLVPNGDISEHGLHNTTDEIPIIDLETNDSNEITISNVSKDVSCESDCTMSNINDSLLNSTSDQDCLIVSDKSVENNGFVDLCSSDHDDIENNGITSCISKNVIASKVIDIEDKESPQTETATINTSIFNEHHELTSTNTVKICSDYLKNQQDTDNLVDDSSLIDHSNQDQNKELINKFNNCEKINSCEAKNDQHKYEKNEKNHEYKQNNANDTENLVDDSSLIDHFNQDQNKELTYKFNNYEKMNSCEAKSDQHKYEENYKNNEYKQNNANHVTESINNQETDSINTIDTCLNRSDSEKNKTNLVKEQNKNVHDLPNKILFTVQNHDLNNDSKKCEIEEKNSLFNSENNKVPEELNENTSEKDFCMNDDTEEMISLCYSDNDHDVDEGFNDASEIKIIDRTPISIDHDDIIDIATKNETTENISLETKIRDGGVEEKKTLSDTENNHDISENNYKDTYEKNICTNDDIEVQIKLCDSENHYNISEEVLTDKTPVSTNNHDIINNATKTDTSDTIRSNDHDNESLIVEKTNEDIPNKILIDQKCRILTNGCTIDKCSSNISNDQNNEADKTERKLTNDIDGQVEIKVSSISENTSKITDVVEMDQQPGSPYSNQDDKRSLYHRNDSNINDTSEKSNNLNKTDYNNDDNLLENKKSHSNNSSVRKKESKLRLRLKKSVNDNTVFNRDSDSESLKDDSEMKNNIKSPTNNIPDNDDDDSKQISENSSSYETKNDSFNSDKENVNNVAEITYSSMEPILTESVKIDIDKDLSTFNINNNEKTKPNISKSKSNIVKHKLQNFENINIPQSILDDNNLNINNICMKNNDKFCFKEFKVDVAKMSIDELKNYNYNYANETTLSLLKVTSKDTSEQNLEPENSCSKNDKGEADKMANTQGLEVDTEINLNKDKTETIETVSDELILLLNVTDENDSKYFDIEPLKLAKGQNTSFEKNNQDKSNKQTHDVIKTGDNIKSELESSSKIMSESNMVIEITKSVVLKTDNNKDDSENINIMIPNTLKKHVDVTKNNKLLSENNEQINKDSAIEKIISLEVSPEMQSENKNVTEITICDEKSRESEDFMKTDRKNKSKSESTSKIIERNLVTDGSNSSVMDILTKKKDKSKIVCKKTSKSHENIVNVTNKNRIHLKSVAQINNDFKIEKSTSFEESPDNKNGQLLNKSKESSSDNEKNDRKLRRKSKVKAGDTKLDLGTTEQVIEASIKISTTHQNITKEPTCSRDIVNESQNETNTFNNIDSQLNLDDEVQISEIHNNHKAEEKNIDPVNTDVESDSKRKLRAKADSKSKDFYKALDDPDFAKYLELKQDNLMDDNPHLSQEEIVQYLFKTWLYEQAMNIEQNHNDDQFVKGVKADEAPKRVRRKKEPKKETDDDFTVDFSLETNSYRDKPKRNVPKQVYDDDSDLEDGIPVFEIFKKCSKNSPKVSIDNNQKAVPSVSTLETCEIVPVNNEHKDIEPKQLVQTKLNLEIVDKSKSKAKDLIQPVVSDITSEIEAYFANLVLTKPNLFKGLAREKVCEICFLNGNLAKCSGCNGWFHVDCLKVQTESVETPTRGRKRKKIRVSKLKDPNSTISSDDLNISDEVENNLVVNADEFEAHYVKKIKDLFAKETLVIPSNEGLNWDDIKVGQCKIVEVQLTSSNVTIIKCNTCSKYRTPLCFACQKECSPKENIVRQRCCISQCNKYYHMDCLDAWPQTRIHSGESSRANKKMNTNLESITCPRHVCHTCVSDDPRGCKTRFSSDKLARCVKCPATYHSFTKCVPAGTVILSASHIICPRNHENKPSKVPTHVNTGWCFICALGGTLICCEYCPTSFHAECLNIKPPEGNYMCEDCETGRLPLYGEMVWVKLGHYRWWPGMILHPSEIPDNILQVKHSHGEFVVRFFGQYDHYWVNRGRVFPFQEGDTGKISSQKSKIDEAFTLAIEHAQRAFEILKEANLSLQEDPDISSSLLPPHYVKLKANKPCGSLINWKIDDDENSLVQCDCDPNDSQPCGENSDCINRMLLTECGPACRAGESCGNRAFEKRLYPKMEPYRTPQRGWGLKTLQDIKEGQFVIEYVGELIDMDEFHRRMSRKHEIRDENYYFLTLDKDRMIDAGPKGNLARFMNHSCEPNCETQKWTVLGDVRVGLFALRDIPANSEVTFNYNLECAGIEKKRCMCGAKRCSGYIGAKPKQLPEQPKKPKIKPQTPKSQTKRVYNKKSKKDTVQITPKPKKPKPPKRKKDLTEIEKDLLIIKSATFSDSDNEKLASKRKSVSFSTEEIVHNVDVESPVCKKMRVEDLFAPPTPPTAVPSTAIIDGV